METSVNLTEGMVPQQNRDGLLAFVTTALDVAIVFVVGASLWSSVRGMIGAFVVAIVLVAVRVAWFFLGAPRRRNYLFSRNTRFTITVVKALAVGTVLFFWVLRATWKVHQHYPDLLPSLIGWITFVIFMAALYATMSPKGKRDDSPSNGDWRTYA